MIDCRSLFLPYYKDPYQVITDAVLVDAPLFSGTLSANDLQYLANQINNELVKTGKSKVVFCQESEGFPESNLTNFNITATFLNTKDVSILSGAVYTETNVRLYSEYRKKNNWTINQFYFTNFWEHVVKDQLTQQLSFHDSFNNTFTKKSKKGLLFVRVARPHRISIIANLLKENILDQLYVSCYLYDKQTLDMDPSLGVVSKKLPNISNEIVKHITTNIDKFPMKLSLNEKGTNIFSITDDSDYYQDSYFSIVPESKFFHDNDKFGEITLEVIMLSEKTYKPISAKQPFVMASYPGSLKALREQGYKTFHPYINESYDSIENDEERLIMINNEITRLCNLSDTEWEEIYNHLLPILQHNYRVLKSAKYVAKKVDFNEY